jgi:hypothetical protein
LTELVVEAIFGVPAGDYSGLEYEKKMLAALREEIRTELPAGYTPKVWVGERDGIAVVLDPNGVVTRDPGMIMRYTGLRLSTKEKVLRWLRKWH